MEGLNDPNPIEASRKTMDASWLFLWTAIGMFVTTGINVACFEMLADRQLVNYRREYFSAVLRMDISWFDLKGGLDLPSSISGDASLLREGIGMKFGQGVMGFATFVLSYVFAFLRGWQLAAVMCASIPALAIVVGVGATYMGKMAAMSTEAYAEAGAIAEENLGNMRTVAAFGGEETAREKFDKLVTKAKAVGVRSAHASGANMGAMMAVMFASYALGFWYGGIMVTDADRLHNSWTDAPWTGGDVMATFFAALMGGMMAGQMGPTFAALLAARGAGGKMYSIVDTVPNIDPASTAGQEPADGGMGEIEFRGARFRYLTRPDVPLFENLNLTIPGGKTTALVGESGSGKSTVMALIQRFYDLDGGAVTIDGVNLKDIKLSWVRKTLGLVSQEPVLFATSVIDNIRYGRLDATDEEIFDAARKANAYEFIMKFDDKFNTYVGEKGSQISGGQKQRIAIARALLHKPKVLLLDEATSALDNQSQKEVQDTINQIISSEKLTVVVIAHRLSTVKDADKICVFERGALVQEGSHDDLLSQSIPNNVYKNLVAGQDTVAAQESGGTTTAAQKMATASASTPGGQELSNTKKEDESQASEHEYEQTWNNGDIIAASGGHGLLIIGLLAAIVAGVAMPVWAVGFSDITLAFYMCEPWSPAVFLQELQADPEFAAAVSDRFGDARLPEPIDGDWNTALMAETAAPYVHGVQFPPLSALCLHRSSSDSCMLCPFLLTCGVLFSVG
jgi:ATP-binding cassette, subfamily B (MDR/TAP), member 1